jgi:NAD(P)-dependent dehydrogenase (short-subunit alcohol dehydrogenase family)
MSQNAAVLDRVTVISGATGGLGKVAAHLFANAGASLALVSRSQEKLDEMAAELGLPEERVFVYACDLSDAEKAEAAAKAVQDRFGRIEILLNVVGGWIGGKTVLETSDEDFRSMLEQHVWAPYNLLKAFVPPMLAGGWGRVLAISTPNALRPPGKNSPYAVGKAGMETLMLSLAQEAKGSGVTANLVLVQAIDAKHERENAPNESNKNWSTPEEISATLLHLCREESSLINGARIPLFGAPL